jgi:hypothetical protein
LQTEIQARTGPDLTRYPIHAALGPIIMTADEDTAEKYDQDDGAQKIRAFSGKLESGFPSENAATQKMLERCLFPI